MHKMRKTGKIAGFLRGFTLIELMIVMAIMVLFITFIYGTFYIVNASHARVAVLNDAKDTANLNMDAIENLIINSSNVVIDNSNTALANHTVITYDSLSRLTYNGVVAFTYPQYTIKTTDPNKDKWDVSATFVKSTAGNAVDVKITIKDRSNDPATVFYTLQKTIFLPNIKNVAGSEITAGVTGSVIKCKYNSWT